MATQPDRSREHTVQVQQPRVARSRYRRRRQTIPSDHPVCHDWRRATGLDYPALDQVRRDANLIKEQAQGGEVSEPDYLLAEDAQTY